MPTESKTLIMQKCLSLLLLVLFATISSGQEIPQQDFYEYDIEKRLEDLGIELREQKLPPEMKIKQATKAGNLLFLSGKGPTGSNGESITGKVGSDLSTEEGYEAARSIAISHLAVIKAEVGDLNKVVQIVKVLGMVNAEPSFTEHPAVINGYTDLMVEVFGERGRHARSAVGMVSLPSNIACEIEVIVEIQEE